MANLIKELEKSKERRLDNSEEFLTDIKLLMGSNATKEIEVLKVIGLDEHITVAEKHTEKILLNKIYTEKFKEEGIVFNFDEILDLGMKYRLFLKQANMYRGVIPNDLGAIVLRMKEKYNLNINNSNNSDRSKFMILAPPSQFTDFKRLDEKVYDNLIGFEESRKSFVKSFQDPILFYRIDREHFLLLKKWGSDFTIGRYLLGLVTRQGVIATLCSFVSIFVMMYLLYTGTNWLLETSGWFSHRIPYKTNLMNSDANTGFSIVSHIFFWVCATVIQMLYMLVVCRAIFLDKSFSTHKFSTKYHFINYN